MFSDVSLGSSVLNSRRERSEEVRGGGVLGLHYYLESAAAREARKEAAPSRLPSEGAAACLSPRPPSLCMNVMKNGRDEEMK